jgi:hypothetical protein
MSDTYYGDATIPGVSPPATDSSFNVLAQAIFTAVPAINNSFSVLAQAIFTATSISARKLNMVCNSPPPGTVGQPYSSQAGFEGGTPPYTVTRTSGSLPTGLSVSSSGLISGTPTVAGTYNYTLQVADSGGQTVTVNCSIVIDAPISQSGGSGVCTQQGGDG